MKDFKKKCRLDKDKVVINGKYYGTDNLHQLPDKLDVFDITTKSNADCIGFFGAVNPLSNFYESRFEVEGVEYIFIGAIHTITEGNNVQRCVELQQNNGSYQFPRL